MFICCLFEAFFQHIFGNADTEAVKDAAGVQGTTKRFNSRVAMAEEARRHMPRPATTNLHCEEEEGTARTMTSLRHTSRPPLDASPHTLVCDPASPESDVTQYTTDRPVGPL